MFWLYLVLGILGGLILIIVLIGFASPRFAKMERSIEINTTPEKVYAQTITPRNFVENWSPWTKRDLNAVQSYSGPESGVGSHYKWSGNKKTVGSGSMEIIDIIENKKVNHRLVFDGRGESQVAVLIDKISDDKVKVTWNFLSDNKNNPIGRLFGRMMDKFLGPDYEEGLKNLKTYLEKN